MSKKNFILLSMEDDKIRKISNIISNDSCRKILDYLAIIGFYKLPLDYLDTWIDRVDAVDVVAVKQAFARRIDPDALVTVVVGAADREEAVAGTAGNSFLSD